MAYDLVIHGMDYQYMRKHEWISKIFCQVTAASHERLRVIFVCVCMHLVVDDSLQPRGL